MVRLQTTRRLSAWEAVSLLAVFLHSGVGVPPASAREPATPEIRTSATHRVPACVTPERLMRLLAQRNANLDPRYRDIAQHYKTHGEALRIRWDYAFYQMVLETNYLMFHRGNGVPGDVRARQNNFAGIGATGGGVPGDSFPDVSTGVLAQMQHLVAYSGERVDKPVAPRTREVQDDVISESRRLRRPVRFADLTNRWAADRNYARSIEAVADRFREAFCNERETPLVADAFLPGAPAKRAAAEPRAGAGLNPSAPARPVQTAGLRCEVWGASYGGPVSLIIRAANNGTVNYTVLQVEAGKEQLQADAYVSAHAPNGQMIERHDSRDAAVARVFQLCPEPS